MKCPVCADNHNLGEPHTFKHINKLVTRPGCPQCAARNQVIDDLCLHIERLNKRLHDLEGPKVVVVPPVVASELQLSASERAKERWRKAKAEGKNRL